MPFRANDTVRHTPSGETWTLACDQEGDWVMPTGWPESLARADECILLEATTDADRLEMLQAVSNHRESSYRSALARAQFTTARLAAMEPV